MKKFLCGRALQYACVLLFVASSFTACMSGHGVLATQLQSPGNSPEEQQIAKGVVSQGETVAGVEVTDSPVGSVCLGPWKPRVKGGKSDNVVVECEATEAGYVWGKGRVGKDIAWGLVPQGADPDGQFTAKSFPHVCTPGDFSGCELKESEALAGAQNLTIVFTPTNLGIGDAPTVPASLKNAAGAAGLGGAKKPETESSVRVWTGGRQKK